MSNAGTAREYVVRDRLAALGYYVIRAAASKGPADLVAIPPGGFRVLFVQVKRGAGRLRPAEWNELLSLASLYGAVPVLAEAVPRRPVAWWRLTGPKAEGTHTGTRTPPWEEFDPARPFGGARLVADASPEALPPRYCPREHRGTWENGGPSLDRLTDGSGWDCPGVAPDGGACGYFWPARPAEVAKLS